MEISQDKKAKQHCKTDDYVSHLLADVRVVYDRSSMLCLPVQEELHPKLCFANVLGYGEETREHLVV